MSNGTAMRPRTARVVHAVPMDKPQLRAVCGRKADGWVQSDCVPDCKQCLRKLAKETQ